MLKAIILRSAKKVFICRTENHETLEVRVRGSLLKDSEVVVGDEVYLEKESEDGGYIIKKIHPRRSEIFRLLPRERSKKVTAANCDVLVIVVSASLPAFKRGLVDRYLVRANQWGIPAILVFNKMDQFDRDSAFDLDFEVERLKFLDVKGFEVSSQKQENYTQQFLNLGFSDLKAFLHNKVALFQGQSGVGKSRLISALTGDKVQLKDQDLGKVNKGKHTTTWSELIEFKDFKLIDSPGIRSFALEDIGKDELINYFPDLHEMCSRCQFPNCQHALENKGCAFYSPAFHSEILLTRLESYRQIFQEVASTPDWKKSFK